MAVQAAPIWQDYYVTLTTKTDPTSPGYDFYIALQTPFTIIYEGMAYPAPGETYPRIRINDICADYLAHNFLQAPATPYEATFVVGRGATSIDAVTFFNDWSYDPHYNRATDGLAFPVVRTFAPGQLLVLSSLAGGIVATITMEDGTMVTRYLNGHTGGDDFNDDYNEDFAIGLIEYGDAFVLPMDDYPGAVQVQMGPIKFTRTERCCRFVLYYVNAHGGWDALPVEGKALRSDALTRHTLERAYDNNDYAARGGATIVNEIRPTWEFWTGWLRLHESERMHHLLNSPSVYVHDLEEDIVRPVLLTASTTEHKDTPGRLYAYKIEARLAQDRIRR